MLRDMSMCRERGRVLRDMKYVQGERACARRHEYVQGGRALCSETLDMYEEVGACAQCQSLRRE